MRTERQHLNTKMKPQCVSCSSWGLKSPHTELQTKTGQAYQTASHGRRALQLSAGSVLLEARGESAHCLFQLLEAPASPRLRPPLPVTGSPSHILPPSEPTPPPCHRTLATALGPADHQHALPFKTLIQSRLLGLWPGEVVRLHTRNPHKAALGVSFRQHTEPWSEARTAGNTSSPGLGNTADERPGEAPGGGEPGGRNCDSAVNTPGLPEAEPRKHSHGTQRRGARPSRRRPGQGRGREAPHHTGGSSPQTEGNVGLQVRNA